MDRKKNNNESEAVEREAYVTPRIVYREPLEAVATSCTPAPPSKGTPVSCNLGPTQS